MNGAKRRLKSVKCRENIRFFQTASSPLRIGSRWGRDFEMHWGPRMRFRRRLRKYLVGVHQNHRAGRPYAQPGAMMRSYRSEYLPHPRSKHDDGPAGLLKLGVQAFTCLKLQYQVCGVSSSIQCMLDTQRSTSNTDERRPCQALSKLKSCLHRI